MATEDHQMGEGSTSAEPRGDHAMADGAAKAGTSSGTVSSGAGESALQHLNVSLSNFRSFQNFAKANDCYLGGYGP
jgi:hypothetical protein